MDLVTHAALGAAVAGIVSGSKSCSRIVLFWGMILGIVPDLDLLIDWQDDLEKVIHHRGFSHSIFLIIPFSLVLSYIVIHIFKPVLFSTSDVLILIFSCLFSHIILDTCTSYGAQLLWPIDAPPIAFSCIHVIDPFYSLPILIGLSILLCAPHRLFALYINFLGVLVSTVYLFFSMMILSSIINLTNSTLEYKNIGYHRAVAIPMPFSIFLWRVILLGKDNYYEGIVSVFDDKNQPIKLHASERLYVTTYIPKIPSIGKIAWFSQGFYSIKEVDNKLVVSDLRIGMYNYYPLSFVVAKLKSPNDPTWTPVKPYIFKPNTINFKKEIGNIIKRMIHRMAGHDLDICEISTGEACHQELI